MNELTEKRNRLMKMLSGSFSNQQQACDNPLFTPTSWCGSGRHLN